MMSLRVDGSKYTGVQTKNAEGKMSLNYIPGLLKTEMLLITKAMQRARSDFFIQQMLWD
jgi:hypothetical protein